MADIYALIISRSSVDDLIVTRHTMLRVISPNHRSRPEMCLQGYIGRKEVNKRHTQSKTSVFPSPAPNIVKGVTNIFWH